MQIKRFLGNIARACLVISSLSIAAVAGANEMYHDSMGYHDSFDGNAPNYNCCNEAPVCSWGYNPPAYLNCGGGCDNFFDTLRFRADFLWWRAYEECLTLGSEDEIDRFTAGEVTEFTEFSNLKRPSSKFDPGFRIGLTTICENCWDIGLIWTHFHTTAHSRGLSDFEDSTEEVIFNSFWEPIVGLVPDEVHGRWTLDLDILDLEFGHKFYVNHCLVLRPHVGLRGARIDQRFKVFSEANRPTGPFSPQLFESLVHAKNDFLAIGPRAGFDLEFKFGCGVAIFGQAAGSIVFGRFHRNAHENFEDLLIDEDIFTHFKSSPQRCSRAITDLAIGLKWDHCFEWCCRYHPVSFAITWEHHAFFDFNNFNVRPNSVDPFGTGFVPATGAKKAGDLFTQGLTVTAELGF